MRRWIATLNASASESQLGLALTFAAFTMALMLWAILWQANIITYQRDLIHFLWNAKFGGSGG